MVQAVLQTMEIPQLLLYKVVDVFFLSRFHCRSHARGV